MASDKLNNKDLNQNFKVKGVWWIPSKEDKQEFAGELIYENGHITLELFGSFWKSLNEHNHNEVIFGLTSQGDKITLLDTFQIRSKMSFPGFKIEVYTANLMLIGFHISSIDSPEIQSVAFTTNHLSNWLSISPFKINEIMEKDGSLKQLNVHYKFPEIFSFKCEINGEQTTVKSTYAMNSSGDAIDQFNMNHSSYLKITPESKRSIKWFHKTIFEIKSLLTLLTGHSLSFNKIIVYGDVTQTINSTEIREKGLLFVRQIKQSTARELQSYDLLITYKDLQKKFQIIFTKWFELKEELDSIYNLVVGNFYRESYLETDFLNLMHSIEGFHRLRYGGKYIKQEEYELYLKNINEIIDNQKLNNDLKQRMKGMLVYGNEFSLRKRIKDLFNKIDEETIKILIGNNEKPNAFIDKIVNTRNHLTHPDKRNIPNLIQTDELFQINHQLKCLAMILLLTTLCVPEKMIAQKLKVNRFYNRLLP
ncbi:HEPN domain-containing protein [Bacillus smithii]|uniref:ApeA N-terminal domain 1-containing protein n=1 Tax=Bacillus smithii TaxID=1479 RepID=UPI003D2542E1